jgi:hypothetical protein
MELSCWSLQGYFIYLNTSIFFLICIHYVDSVFGIWYSIQHLIFLKLFYDFIWRYQVQSKAIFKLFGVQQCGFNTKGYLEKCRIFSR